MFFLKQRSPSLDRPRRQEGGQGPAGAAGSGFSTYSILPGINSPRLFITFLCFGWFYKHSNTKSWSYTIGLNAAGFFQMWLMCVTFPDRPSWILLLELITRKHVFPCYGISFPGVVTNWNVLNTVHSLLCCCYMIRWLLCVCAGRWCCCGTRKVLGLSSWPPTWSELTGTRKHKGEATPHTVCRWKILWKNENNNAFTVSKPGCGWALCFHDYHRAAMQVQVSPQPSLRGTCWCTWHRTAHLTSRSGSNESKSMICQRPGNHTVTHTEFLVEHFSCDGKNHAGK